MTSFRSQNIAKHSVMWMIPNSFLGSLPINFTKSSLLLMMTLKKFQAGAVEIPTMLINSDKTKLLFVGVPQLMRTLPATVPSATSLGTEIKPVTVAKELGVYIDSHLN